MYKTDFIVLIYYLRHLRQIYQKYDKTIPLGMLTVSIFNRLQQNKHTQKDNSKNNLETSAAEKLL